MREKEIDSIKINEFQIFDRYENDIIAAFSTRFGGASKGDYESMNLSFYIGDKNELVFENYKRFSNAIGIEFENLVFSAQKHHNNIKIVKKEDAGKGLIKPRDYDDIDGLVTNVKGLPLTTLHADCTPIFFYDPINCVIGLAHAGWRGTTMEIVGNMIDIMVKKFDSNVSNIKIAIGPAICGKCYEVGEDVKIELDKMSLDVSEWIIQKDEKYYIDIAQINKKILLSKGILNENIELDNLCTKENSEMYFSHRKHGLKRGCQAAFIQLKNK